MKLRTLLCSLLALLLTLTALVGCSALSPNTQDVVYNVSVLNGTTGFGAAKLMTDKLGNFQFAVETDASNITAGLINGSIDIAALPTNAAATVYNKTEGKVKIVAVNTLGVLYLMVNGEKETITSLSDLEGKTVYCPAQNPAFIFEAICLKNGLVPGENITIDTAFAQPADLRTALASGQVDIAVLPEPMVTIAKSANEKLTVACDLTAEWEKSYGAGSLMQGCIVVRTEWADSHPEELEEFLTAYKASVEFTTANPKEAAIMIADLGIFAQAAVAEKAIPKCNIVYVDGDEMATALDIFFQTLYDINPASVGGKLPDSGIYLTK